MNIKRFIRILMLIGIVIIPGCKNPDPSGKSLQQTAPQIMPDYTGVTVPPNIAPLNFLIKQPGDRFNVTATSSRSGYSIDIYSCNGKIRFPIRKWKRLLSESKGDSIIINYTVTTRKERQPGKISSFAIHVSTELIDPYLAYRLIHPGYYSWSRIRIMQRSLENFSEHPVFDNQMLEKNCANCHAFSNRSSEKFMIHVRGSKGGTYFAENGALKRTDPKIAEMPGSATYPAWHPNGKFLAFSSNQVRQSFYARPGKNIEVFDLVSGLILFDSETNEIFTISEKDTASYLFTFPSWSPDGKYLYFCRAAQVIKPENPELEQIRNTHYDIVRKEFFPETRSFGESQIVVDASGLNKSASFPRISPDGKSLVYTLADYGTFPIWHREADLYMVDLVTGNNSILGINSDETESYHTWSASGRWLVFSSKRTDGRSARPYFAYVDEKGRMAKEFVLPQKDPSTYDRMLESFNIPEFVNGRIRIGPRDFLRASKYEAMKAGKGKSADSVQIDHELFRDVPLKTNERAIH